MTDDHADHGLAEALHADEPDPALAGELMLFGRFVGSWRVDWTGADRTGEPASMTGELHVGWVLGGRAVQDTWIVPGRDRTGDTSHLRTFHGTTVRFYDPALGAWRSTWIEPVNARARRFIGRPAGDDIVLLSDEEEPYLRWRFSEIGASSMRWSAEISHDRGQTWAFEEEMRLTRTHPAGDSATDPSAGRR